MKYVFLGSGGEHAPTRIKFMGRVNFEVGVPTEVSDPEVLAKLKTHKFFKQCDKVVIESNVIDVEEVVEAPTGAVVSYHDKIKAIAAAGKKPASRSKADVEAAYAELAEAS